MKSRFNTQLLRALPLLILVFAAGAGCAQRSSKELQSPNEPALQERRLLLLALPKEPNAIELTMSQAFMSRGTQNFEIGEYAAAAQNFTDAISADPSNASLYYFRAAVRLRQERLAEALEDLSLAIETGAQPLYFLSRCGAYFAAGALDAAISDCTETIRRSPMESDAYFLRSLTYYSKGDLERALADSLTILMIRPDDANARHLIDEILTAKETRDRGYPTAPGIKTNIEEGGE